MGHILCGNFNFHIRTILLLQEQNRTEQNRTEQNKTELYYDLSIYSPSSYYTKDKAFINAVHTRNVCNPVRVDIRLTCVGVNKVNNY